MKNEILKDISYDPERGGLFYKETRYLFIRPEVIITFQKEIEKELGEKAHPILFKSGLCGGILSSKRYQDIYKLSDEETVHFMLEMGRQIGWGRFELELFNTIKRYLKIKVYFSPFAEAYGPSERPVCHFIRGVIAGLGSVVFRSEIHAEEIRCLSMGNPFCSFEIKGINLFYK